MYCRLGNNRHKSLLFVSTLLTYYHFLLLAQGALDVADQLSLVFPKPDAALFVRWGDTELSGQILNFFDSHIVYIELHA